MFWVLLMPLFFYSCEDKMDEHYEIRLSEGSAWEVLEKDGNYSIFLQAIEKIGYRQMVAGKSLLTVMAPDDEAFNTYLAEQGYSSIDAMDTDELSKLVGFHLIDYSFTKSKMENYRPSGDLEDSESAVIRMGQYYKFPTNSSDAPTVEYDATNNKYVTVWHSDRFIPVFSHYFFSTREIDAKTNYEYFYPNSTWTGSDGFNVSNASVVEYEIPADNGYIYKIDRVLEPLETIHTELKNDPDYSIFLNMYDYFATYVYDATYSTNYGESAGVDSLYTLQHTNLPNIAQEWPVSSYLDLASLMSVGYSVFAPSNTALNNYFQSYWAGKGYDSIDDLDPVIYQYLITSCVYSGSAVFPEDVVNGDLITNGVGLSFDPYTDVTNRKMCVNGVFYGLDLLTEPQLFTSVVGALFQYSDFRAALYAFDGSGLISSMSSTSVQYILLVPTNDQLAANEIEVDHYGTGDLTLQTPDSEGFWGAASTTTMQNIANLHTITGVEALAASGGQVLPTQVAYNYMYVYDSEITSSARFANSIVSLGTSSSSDPFSTFSEVDGDWYNGRVYTYGDSRSYEIASEELNNDLEWYLANGLNSVNYPYYAFSWLLSYAGISDQSDYSLTNLTVNSEHVARFVVFVPTNDAITTALENGDIPGVSGTDIRNLTVTDQDALADYLNDYFILSSLNTISVYPYPGSNFSSGAYGTYGDVGSLIYNDNGTEMTVALNNGTNTCTVVPVSSYADYCFPLALDDGCAQFIDSVLK